MQQHSADASRTDLAHLSTKHYELLSAVLSQRTPDDCSIPDSRPVIRKIVSSCAPAERPEQALVAFKKSLDDVANDLRIPLSAERNTLVTGLVTAFIEEMYSSALVVRDSACRGK